MCHLLLPSDPRRLFTALRVKSSSLTQRTWHPPTPVQTHLCSHACPECVLPSTSSTEPSLSYFRTQRPLGLVFSDAISPSPVCSCPPVPSAVWVSLIFHAHTRHPCLWRSTHSNHHEHLSGMCAAPMGAYSLCDFLALGAHHSALNQPFSSMIPSPSCELLAIPGCIPSTHPISADQGALRKDVRKAHLSRRSALPASTHCITPGPQFPNGPTEPQYHAAYRAVETKYFLLFSTQVKVFPFRRPLYMI